MSFPALIKSAASKHGSNSVVTNLPLSAKACLSSAVRMSYNCKKGFLKQQRTKVIITRVIVAKEFITILLITASRFCDLILNLCTYLIIKLIRHLGFRCSCPLGAPIEVFFDQRSIRTVLEEPGPPRHWRLDNFVSNHQQNITRHRRVQTGRLEIRGFIYLEMTEQS